MINDELMNKAKQAASTEELLELAKSENIELTEEKAEKLFAELHAEGELSDTELDAVAGGGCYARDGRMVITVGYVCAEISGCPHCKNSSMRMDSSGCVYCNTCNRQLTCKDCDYMSYEGGMWLCSHELNRS